MNGKKQVVLYEWPLSQECMECKHSQFVMGDPFANSNYLCMVNYMGNDGHCRKKIKNYDD